MNTVITRRPEASLSPEARSFEVPSGELRPAGDIYTAPVVPASTPEALDTAAAARAATDAAYDRQPEQTYVEVSTERLAEMAYQEVANAAGAVVDSRDAALNLK